ncbi:hypothetical protein FB548_2337 [Pseudoxanthomonas sp. 3HH-4]|uniref:hypothetical protein n=1 Tax=Pseudoxanthomonas sp. 3HH-4 TaxID=1690214 RepID=UPI00114DEE6C|nr:hypothetical protein [Pseudoxanthomonas sp. 3HH-4]TQM12403.1 hypothetical protein FB548_2337 [Pseudoxanthomonas sp. 3HH-4]
MKEQVEKLDGFLSGVAAFSGALRDHTAFSYVVSLSEARSSAEEALAAHFSWRPNLTFSSVHVLQHGVADLELELRPFLVKNFRFGTKEEVSDLRKYLSFRVMEYVCAVVEDKTVSKVLKLVADSGPYESSSVFFCVCLEAEVLFMQFNDDTGFKKGRVPLTERGS